MKVKLTGGVVVAMQKRKAGDEIEVAGREGRQLINRGLAVEILQVKAKPEPVDKPKAAPKKKRSRKKSIIEE